MHLHSRAALANKSILCIQKIASYAFAIAIAVGFRLSRLLHNLASECSLIYSAAGVHQQLKDPVCLLRNYHRKSDMYDLVCL